MWKEITDFIEKVASPQNKEELMTVYLTYIVNPFKSLKKCEQYKIAIDLIALKKTFNEDSKIFIEKLKKTKFKSTYIQQQIVLLNNIGYDIAPYKNLIKQNINYIELAFILKNIQKLHNYERMKYIVATLLAILSIVATIKITIIQM